MNCPRCSTHLVEGGRYCWRCGADLREDLAHGSGRRHTYAAHPGEPVLSFNLASSLMPLASGTAPQTYKFALAAGTAVPLVAAALGYLPFAFAAAALVLPAVYVLYLYDVNEWEDQPVPVVLGTMAVTAVLGAAFTLLWRTVLLDDGVRGLGRRSDLNLTSLLVACLLVPLVGEAVRQLGPVLLARRPAFDDLIDGLTFGITAGVTYAAVETLILNGNLILSGDNHVSGASGSFWASIVLVNVIVKPLVYGSATGLAVAAFSGVGEGYRGLSRNYARGLVEAIAANVVFQLGLFILGRLGGNLGPSVSLLFGLTVAGYLILRVRVLLHTALLESALEAAAVDSTSRHAVHTIGFCSECDMPLVHEALFCTACGTSIRAASKPVRRDNATPSDDHDLVTTGGTR